MPLLSKFLTGLAVLVSIPVFAGDVIPFRTNCKSLLLTRDQIKTSSGHNPVSNPPQTLSPLDRLSAHDIVPVSKFINDSGGIPSVIESRYKNVVKIEGGGSGTLLIPQNTAGYSLIVTSRNIHETDDKKSNREVPETLNYPSTDGDLDGILFATDGAKDLSEKRYGHRFYTPVRRKPNQLLTSEDFIFDVLLSRDLQIPKIGPPLLAALPTTEAKPSELVVLMGFPTAVAFKGQMQFCVGVAVENSRTSTREPYEHEFFVMVDNTRDIHQFDGFTGGPVFNYNGEFLGILSRVERDNESTSVFFRVVRASFMFEKLSRSIDSTGERRDDFLRMLRILE